jgi:hypothetical protein
VAHVAVVVLVVEELAVDGLAARAVEVREVAGLAHEVGQHAVEDVALEPQRHVREADALLARAEAAEVLAGLRAQAREELHLDAADALAVDVDVEEDLGVAGQPRDLVDEHPALRGDDVRRPLVPRAIDEVDDGEERDDAEEPGPPTR